MPYYRNKDGSYTQTPTGPDSVYVEQRPGDATFNALRGAGNALRTPILNAAAPAVDFLLEPNEAFIRDRDEANRRRKEQLAQDSQALVGTIRDNLQPGDSEQRRARTQAVVTAPVQAYGRNSVQSAGLRAPNTEAPGGVVGTTPQPQAQVLRREVTPQAQRRRTAEDFILQNVPESQQFGVLSRENAPGDSAERRAQLRSLGPTFQNVALPSDEAYIVGRQRNGTQEFVGAGFGEGGPVNNGIGTPELRAQAQQLEQRYADGGRRFGGGAAPGGQSLLRQVNAINRRAQDAFNQALKSGMNTKGATRVADNIRAQAEDILGADFNAIRREDIDVRRQGIAAQLQSDFARSQGEAAQARDAELLDYYKGFATRVDDSGKAIFDPNFFSRTLRQVGGVDALRQLPPNVGGAFFERGVNAQKILDNVNRVYKGSDLRLEDLGDLLEGASLTQSGRLGESEVSLWDVLRSPNVDLQHIFGRKIRLGDGTLIPVDDLFRGATLTRREREALIEDEN